MSVTDQNVSALPASEAAGEAAMSDWAELLVARARDEGVELTGDGGLLTGLVRQVLQTGLEVEMAEHLGYERHAREGRGTPNSRNGSTPNTVKTEIGEVGLRVPRDRAGTVEPVTVPKHRRRLDGLSGNVISLYAKGLTTSEIGAHLAEIYDTSVSRETISKITDEIVADMAVWQNRPLDAGRFLVVVANGGVFGVVEVCQDFVRGAVAEHDAGPVVELVGGAVQVGSRVHGQVRALGEVLAEQAVGVLVGGSLPG